MATNLDNVKAASALFAMLSDVFLRLPTRDGVVSLLATPVEQLRGDDGAEALAEFVAENRDRDAETVLTEMAIDRAALVRGTGAKEVKPPYECLYVGRNQNDVMGSLNRYYAEQGFEKQDGIHDTSDQIGVELAFVAAMLERQSALLEAGEYVEAEAAIEAVSTFRSQHLNRWAGQYADALINHADTGYWRAVGLLLRGAISL